MNKGWLFLIVIILLIACKEKPLKKLPYLGTHKYKKINKEGKITVDTLFHSVKPFSFLNQDSILIKKDHLLGKIYVADFFFTTCPDICPIMTTNMLTVYNRYKDSLDFKILSYTIDPYNDSIPALKQYALNLGLNDKQDTWHFLYGDQVDIFLLAKESYFVDAENNKKAPKGIVHSGSFALIDRQGRVRGIYDGTSKVDTDRLLKDISLLYSM